MYGFRAVILAVVAVVLTTVATADAGQTAIRFLILPFDIYSVGDIHSLRREVNNTVASRFEEEGAEVVGIEEIKRLMLQEGVESFDEERAVAIGGKAGADFAVLGSITRLNGTVSIDWRVYDLAHKRNISFFFKKGDDRMMLMKELEGLVVAAYNTALSVMVERPAERSGIIDEIDIIGNQRVDREAILWRVATKVGHPFSLEGIRDDIKSIYGMGYFEDVKAELIDFAAGKKLIFTVRERPYIKRVEIAGNDEISKEKIEGVVTVKENTILNRALLKENAEAIRLLYESEGHYLAEVVYEVTVEESTAVVTFSINEGDPVRVRRITVIGNENFTDDEIKKVMETKEVWLFSFLTGAGKFNEFIFNHDLDSVRDLYFNNGYIQAEIVDHRVLLSEDKRWFYITIAVSEGEQYSVGSVDITGEMVTTKEEMLEGVKLAAGEVFSRKVLREDMARFKDIYGDKGYAKVDINPITAFDHDKKTIDITFDIKKGPLVYIEQIDIDGNTQTRDKVIRRELEVEEEKLYSSTGIRRSRNNLRRLGYFDEVAISERPGSAEDRLSLNVRVKERPTGQISAGFGYSSVDKFIGTASISQRNLAGTGIKLDLSATVGGSSERYNLGFTEPWLFDKPISAGFDVFKTSREFTAFTEKSTGFDIRLGFPLYWKDTRGFLSYKNEEIEITDVDDNASSTIKEQEGKSDTRSMNGTVRRDTRNDAFFPTKGSISSLSVEYAGGPLGGDNNFVKYITKAKKFFPLPWETALSVRGEYGAVDGFGGTPVPVSERFFLGGINSIRGFRPREIGPKDPDTDEAIGGDRKALFNVEFLFPLIAEQRVTGVIFYDMGNAFNGWRIEFDELRRSAGFGVRWFSPIGPLRLEWGFNLDRREGEKNSQFEFTLGTSF